MNTTAYRPQTDGLVECFNRTLTDMLAKTVETTGHDWDTHLPYVLFACRSSLQESTKESPIFFQDRRNPSLPSEETLSLSASRQPIGLDEYKSGLRLAEAWHLAQANIRKAQQKQKQMS